MTVADRILPRLGPRANFWPRLHTRMRGGPSLAHHGIQRSGTNYLLKSLRVLGCLPLNMFDPARDQPQHKHFRWQSDKSSITLERRFVNTVMVDGLAALDRVAGYPAETRHLVMQKRLDDWCISIVNWGLFCGWWPDVNAALADRDRIFEEYHYYHVFWHCVADQAPDRVAILDLDRVRNSGGRAIVAALDRLRVPVAPGRRRRFDGHFTTVPMSAARRKDYLDAAQKADLKAEVAARAERRGTPFAAASEQAA